MLSKLFHFHSWEGSAWNRYYVEHEQRCRCGCHRWRKLDVCRERQEPWRPGEHPEAARLRAAGLVKNY
jgi:hypothetical protein